MGLTDWFGGNGNENNQWATAAALVPGMAAPILQFGGATAANNANRQANWDATNTSLEEAQRNRDFQERMSDTAWQRATADMSKAGVNPMLAVTQGPASAPSGSTGSPSVARMDNTFSGAISSAMDGIRMGNELQQQSAQRDLMAAQAATESTKQLLNTSSAKAADAGTDVDVLRKQALGTQIRAITAKAKADEIRSNYDAKFAPYDAWAARIGAGTGIVSDAVSIGTKGLLNKSLIDNFLGRKPPTNKNWGTFNKGTGEIYE